MAVSIGKRKRRKGDQDETDNDDHDEGAMRSLFQRAFEAKFTPLERASSVAEPMEVEEADGDDESDWSGISEEETEEAIQTYHAPTLVSDHDAQREARKAFMTSKPPSSSTAKSPSLSKQQPKTKPEDDPGEATNLKHDLALQRLLKESHLLDSNAFNTQTPEVSGKSRLKALDLRLKDLGAKKSSLEQQKMPLSHRRGITAKAADREDRRRKDARENGVILERAKHAAKASQTRRVRNVGGPAIGKFRGGALRLGARDVKAIQGPPEKRKRR